jgi:hypothetical protein
VPCKVSDLVHIEMPIASFDPGDRFFDITKYSTYSAGLPR